MRGWVPSLIALAVPAWAGCIVQEDPRFQGASADASDAGATTGSTSETGTGSGTSTTDTGTTGTGTTGTGTSDTGTTGTTDTSSSETGPDPVDHTIFVTSTIHTGKLNGRAGADAICTDRATEAMLDGAWVALISGPDADARDAISIDGPVYNMDDVLLAADADALWGGSILETFNIDETGNQVGNRGWTGTASDGTGTGEHCDGWSAQSGGFQGTLGNANSTGSTWVDDGTGGCAQSFHLFCIRVG